MHNILICLCLVMPLLVMGMPDITGFQRLDECVQRGQSCYSNLQCCSGYCKLKFVNSVCDSPSSWINSIGIGNRFDGDNNQNPTVPEITLEELINNAYGGGNLIVVGVDNRFDGDTTSTRKPTSRPTGSNRPTTNNPLNIPNENKSCRGIGESCSTSGDCCTNRCLTYAHKCVT